MQKVGSVTETADQNSEFTNGNVAQGVQPTILESAIFNTWQREMCNVVEGSGISLDPKDDGQVLKAIKKTNKDQAPASLSTSGYQKLPSGLIIQWGVLSVNPEGATSVEIMGEYPMKFPNDCFQVIPCLQDLAGSTGSRTDGVSLFSNKQFGQQLLIGPKISVYGLNLGSSLSVRYLAIGM
ncbi:hypothetical protein NJH77_24475 [Serratia fonticola]|uniref:gp53-like domain-containing protein n=1 Tax=Serratia fonticola TaxID=47917 RepID=UPI002096879D|nr:hypothetical protein [Serratia fonticola]MCO7512408.1 hypothetical protein [Serratia fonticola]